MGAINIKAGPMLAFAACLGACSGNPPDIAVAAKWNDAIQRYNLVPIYPMREDVQIGDVFLYLPPLHDSHQSRPATWLNRLASADRDLLLAALNDSYCARIRIAPAEVASSPAAAPAPSTPATTIENTTTVQGVSATQKISLAPPAKPPAAPAKPTPAKAPVARCAQGGGDGVVYPPDVGRVGAAADLRLHAVELPDLAVASFTEGELGAAAPIQAVLAQLGLAASAGTALSIKLTGVEEVHLPFSAEFDLFERQKQDFVTRSFPPGKLFAYLSQRQPELLPALCNRNLAALDASKMLILVANQVIYAQGIEYAYGSSSSLAGKVSVSLGQGGAANGAPDAGQARLSALTGSLGGAGGTLQAGIGRTGALTLSDSFKQPMAFGIGDLLEFSPSDLLRLYDEVLADDSIDAAARGVVRDSQARGQLRFCSGAQGGRPLRFRPAEGLPVP